MHPFLSSDAVFVPSTRQLIIDDRSVSLSEANFDFLVQARHQLKGRMPLSTDHFAEPGRQVVEGLAELGIIHDLQVTDHGVDSAQFSDYLYARTQAWRMHKSPQAWPWRTALKIGSARIEYLQGIIMENMHYVRAAPARQSPMLASAMSAEIYDLVRGFVLGEGDHAAMFVESLARWGISQSDIAAAVPLPVTVQFIALQEHLAHRSILDYLAGSAVLEVDPAVYGRVGDPYEQWQETYGVAPDVLEPVRAHIREDVEEGHYGLFRAVAQASGKSLPLVAARSAVASARAVFSGTREWQRSMFEHYQVRNLGFPSSEDFTHVA